MKIENWPRKLSKNNAKLLFNSLQASEKDSNLFRTFLLELQLYIKISSVILEWMGKTFLLMNLSLH